MPEPIIELSQLTKSFGADHAVRNIGFTVNEGEFFSLVGPSGCGKTTLLRMIAGLEHVTSGHISIDGKSMAAVPAHQRPTNMVFQNYAVFPHMNVAENVGYGLRRNIKDRSRLAAEVDHALAMVDLTGFGARNVNKLSGGQKQRVALARALVMKPKVLLLDEPMSALDKNLREQMQLELHQLQQSLGITFILVTHDQKEALLLSDRVGVMFDGEIAQIATAEDLYRRPVSRQVASFVGQMNFLDAQCIGQSDEGLCLSIEGLGPVKVPHSNHSKAAVAGTINCIGVRPEMLTLSSGGNDEFKHCSHGTLIGTSFYGDVTHYKIQLSGQNEPMTVSRNNSVEPVVAKPGSDVVVGWDPKTFVVFTDG